MNETSQPSPEPTTVPSADTRPAKVVVRYRYADGVLLDGDTSPHEDAIKKARPRWRWFRSLRKWGVPLSRERVMSSHQVEEYARGLLVAGVPHVQMDFQEPRPEDVGDFVKVLEERAQSRAERLEREADRLDVQDVAEHVKRRVVLDRTSMVQPNLVGHRSEGSHHRDLARADASMRRSVEASEGAKNSRRQAGAAEHGAAKHEKPGLALRRVLELAKEARELQVKITGEVPTGWRGPSPDGPATGESLSQLRTAAEQNRQKTAHYRRVLTEAGYMPSSQTVLRKGDRVLTDKGGAIVRKALAKHVELRFDRPVRWRNGPQYVQWNPYSRVWVLETTVERQDDEEESPPAPGAGSATTDIPKPFATLVAKHHNPKGYTVPQIIDALVEAERLGVGPKLAAYFRARIRTRDVPRAYERALGIVAFERRGWSPLRDGAEDFSGLLTSLLRGSRSVVRDRGATGQRKVSRGEDATPEVARSVRDALVALAAKQLHDLYAVKEPTLYEPEPAPEGISRVELHPEDEAAELCDGESTRETLGEGAAKREAAETDMSEATAPTKATTKSKRTAKRKATPKRSPEVEPAAEAGSASADPAGSKVDDATEGQPMAPLLAHATCGPLTKGKGEAALAASPSVSGAGPRAPTTDERKPVVTVASPVVDARAMGHARHGGVLQRAPPAGKTRRRWPRAPRRPIPRHQQRPRARDPPFPPMPHHGTHGPNHRS